MVKQLRRRFPNLTIFCPQECQALAKRTPIKQEDTFKDFSMLNRILRKIGGERSGKRKSEWKWPSETSKCRNRLAPFCKGYGLDVGFGGDTITFHAIRVDLPTPYTKVGQSPVQLGGGAGRLISFRDECLNFTYSSHLLED
jgi:hypothetical protein